MFSVFAEVFTERLYFEGLGLNFADVVLPKLGNFDVCQPNRPDFNLVHTFLFPTIGFALWEVDNRYDLA